jgi:ATP-dependent Clp protease adaptor protein ClpS
MTGRAHLDAAVVIFGISCDSRNRRHAKHPIRLVCLSGTPSRKAIARHRPSLQHLTDSHDACQQAIEPAGYKLGTDHSHDTGEQADTSVLTRDEVKPPRRFAVILHNDDYTTMEFVILVLMRLFGRNETEAAKIMLEVHHKGKGVAGVYVRDVAESKVEQVEEFARSEGHPLKCTAEPIENGGDEFGTGAN